MTNRQAYIILGSILGVSIAALLILSTVLFNKEHPGLIKYTVLYKACDAFPDNEWLQDELYQTMIDNGYITDEAADLIDAFRQ